MAITNRKTGTVTHEGLVLEAGLCQCDRVMSDIYADQWYALVWDPEKGEPRKVLTASSFELSTVSCTAEVDATPEVRAAYEGRLARLEAAQKVANEARCRAAAEQHARELHDAPTDGKRMLVVRSWKAVRRGTEGEVFWVRGNRVGLRTSDRKEDGRWADVVWCQASQLRNAEPFSGMTPVS